MKDKLRIFRIAVLSIVLLTAFQPGASACRKGLSTGKDYDIYLLIGQSNMAGRGELLEEDRLPMDGIYLLDTLGNIVPATSPINRYSTIRKGLGMQGYSLGVSFAQAIHEKNGRPVLLVVNARGGTNIAQWLEGTRFYDEAVRRTRQAMQYGKLKGIIWHQGEGDATEERLPLYVDRFQQLARSLRRDLGNVRIVIGETNPSYSKADLINPELRRAARKVRRCRIVSAEGCECKSDKVHFSREGARIFGIRYAEALR